MLDNITMVGVFGDKDSGRSVVAKFLQNYYGFTRIGLLDPVRFMVKEVLLLSGMSDEDIAKDDSHFEPTDSEVYTIQMIKAYYLLTGKEASTKDLGKFIQLLYAKLPINELYKQSVYLVANKVIRQNNPDTLLSMLTSRVVSLAQENPKAHYRIVVEDIATVGEAVFIESFFGTLIKVVKHSPLEKNGSNKVNAEVADAALKSIQSMFTVYNTGNIEHVKIETAAVASVLGLEPVVKLPRGYRKRVPEVLESLSRNKAVTDSDNNFLFQFEDDLIQEVV